MKLVHWDPFLELVAMGSRRDRRPDAPPVDIFERQDQLVIRADLPGLRREDMEVQIENGVLTLRGERKPEAEIDDDNAFRMERTYGAFTRRFSLPRTVDASRITAAYKDGVLEVSVPKVETAKSKKVEIQAA